MKEGFTVPERSAPLAAHRFEDKSIWRMANSVWRQTRANSRWLMADSMSQKNWTFFVPAISHTLLSVAISYQPYALSLAA